MFGILRWHTLEHLFCLTSAGLERMKHIKSLRGAAPTRTRLRGAAPTPLALPYPLGTSMWMWMDAECDKGEVAKILYFAEVILRRRLYLIITSAASG